MKPWKGAVQYAEEARNAFTVRRNRHQRRHKNDMPEEVEGERERAHRNGGEPAAWQMSSVNASRRRKTEGMSPAVAAARDSRQVVAQPTNSCRLSPASSARCSSAMLSRREFSLRCSAAWRVRRCPPQACRAAAQPAAER